MADTTVLDYSPPLQLSSIASLFNIAIPYISDTSEKTSNPCIHIIPGNGRSKPTFTVPASLDIKAPFTVPYAPEDRGRTVTPATPKL